MLAFVTSLKSPQLNTEDAQVAENLRLRGYTVEAIPWERLSDPQRFDLIVIRTPWNYQHHLPAFIQWLEQLETANARVLNSISTIRWNLDKRYLLTLQNEGVPIVPTRFLEGGALKLGELLETEAKSLRCEEFVLKPVISASGLRTYRLRVEDGEQDQHKLDEILRTGQAMLQPFLPKILSEGELSFLFFNETFSHAIRKVPAQGEFRIQLEWGGSATAFHPSETQLQAADKVLLAAKRFVRDPLLYARVDLIEYQGALHLGEIELFEPYLNMKFSDGATDRFTEAILRHLS